MWGGGVGGSLHTGRSRNDQVWVCLCVGGRSKGWQGEWRGVGEDSGFVCVCVWGEAARGEGLQGLAGQGGPGVFAECRPDAAHIAGTAASWHGMMSEQGRGCGVRKE